MAGLLVTGAILLAFGMAADPRVIAPVNDPIHPPFGTDSGRTLELTEVGAFTLPPAVDVAGAALSPDGTRAAVWLSTPNGVLYFERGVGLVQSAAGEQAPHGEVAGVAFLDDSTLGIIHSGGRVSTAEWGDWTHRDSMVIPVPGIRSAVLGDDGWWLLTDGTGEGSALYFLPGHDASNPVPVMPVAASPDRASLSTAAADALLALRDPPYPVWRIGVDASIVAWMQPDRLPASAPERDPRPYWMGLGALSVAPGVVHVVADLTSDDRLLVTYDEDGGVLSSRVVEAPFGLIATASRAQVLAALRVFSTSEIVMYSWRWRLRAPA